LDSLLGTSALKPYMHGYFVHLKLYDTARVAADPIGWERQREKAIKEKMEKLADSRIRTRKGNKQAVKVNQRLAEKIMQQEEKEQRKTERLRKRKLESGENAGAEDSEAQPRKETLLNDPRFKSMFEDPAFQVDESSRQWALLNPSTAASTSVSDRHANSFKIFIITDAPT
jgi:ribosome biogenesis protein ENP2